MKGNASVKRSWCWKASRRGMMLGCLEAVRMRASRTESWGAIIRAGVVTFRATVRLVEGSRAR
jgi:hypothetical protein